MASVVRILFGLVLLALLAPGRGHAADAKTAGSGRTASIQVIAGEQAETALADDMAELFATRPSPRILPLQGDAGLGNLARLLAKPQADVAFVSTDALAEAAAGERGASLSRKLELIARLCPQEVHILARRDIGSLADLAGQKVNFGPTGASSAVTAERLFRALAIKVEPQPLEARAALQGLKRGDIAALVVVGGKPVPLIGEIPSSLGLHLLPVPFAASVQDSYLPTRFEHDDYPNLIEAEAAVPSLATGMVLLAAQRKNDAKARARVALFIETLFSRFGELERSGHHVKWREINLAAALPGWTRASAAAAWLARRPNEGGAPPASKRPPNTSVQASAAGAAPLSLSDDQKETLFKGFVEWQRAKGH